MAYQHSTLTATSTDVTPPAGTRLRGWWLALAWVGWSILVLLSLINFISSIPTFLVDVQTLCQGSSCAYQQPTVAMAQTLQRVGLSVSAYAVISIAINSVLALLGCAISAVIVWRRPRDWMVLLTTAMLITQALYELNYLPTPFDDPASSWYPAGLFLSSFVPLLVIVFCVVFPNGRVVPRWLGWVLLGMVLVNLPFSLFPSLPFGNLIDTLFTISAFPLFLGAQIYRYRRVSTAVERQQTKWVVYSVSLTLLAFITWYIPQPIFPALSQTGTLYSMIGGPLLALFFCLSAVGIAIAIMRYRLWDIDTLINRTLVYGSLTFILAACYAGLIVGLAVVLTGQAASQQPVVLVISTLIIAALFQPLRKRLQNLIDRRFYRRKYDMGKTLAAFNATLRHEVDLNELREHLLGVVQETMQPTHVSLWLRPSASSTKHRIVSASDTHEKM